MMTYMYGRFNTRQVVSLGAMTMLTQTFYLLTVVVCGINCNSIISSHSAAPGRLNISGDH